MILPWGIISRDEGLAICRSKCNVVDGEIVAKDSSAAGLTKFDEPSRASASPDGVIHIVEQVVVNRKLRPRQTGMDVILTVDVKSFARMANDVIADRYVLHRTPRTVAALIARSKYQRCAIRNSLSTPRVLHYVALD